MVPRHLLAVLYALLWPFETLRRVGSAFRKAMADRNDPANGAVGPVDGIARTIAYAVITGLSGFAGLKALEILTAWPVLLVIAYLLGVWLMTRHGIVIDIAVSDLGNEALTLAVLGMILPALFMTIQGMVPGGLTMLGFGVALGFPLLVGLFFGGVTRR
jgi:hypothetical protein